ncbi:MAG TPA: hypothetical protein VK990_10010, partial [Acidimicrobiia bacterium]|nr:hypothetical protein [Acidimicrobiia bacterium]
AEEYSEPVIGAEMWFPRAKGKGFVKRTLDLALIDEVRRKMEDVTHSIRDEAWEPRVSIRCDRCEFRLSCPAWPEGKGAYLP